MESPTDHGITTRYSLLLRLQNWQDGESWQNFFDTYSRLIYSVAIRAGLTETEAQEVVQETIISVANSIHTFKRDRALGSFKGWLRNLTRWRIADQLRKRTRRPSDLNEPAEIPESTDEGMDAAWEHEWRTNLLHQAIERVKSKVKEEQFQIFDLCAVRQWPVNKIAQTLGVSLPRIYLAKHRVAALIKKEVAALEKGEQFGKPL